MKVLQLDEGEENPPRVGKSLETLDSGLGACKDDTCTDGVVARWVKIASCWGSEVQLKVWFQNYCIQDQNIIKDLLSNTVCASAGKLEGWA